MTSLSLLVMGQKVGGGLEKVHFKEKEILVDEFFFFFAVLYNTWNLSSPNRVESALLGWKCGVLTPGLPGKSLGAFF